MKLALLKCLALGFSAACFSVPIAVGTPFFRFEAAADGGLPISSVEVDDQGLVHVEVLRNVRTEVRYDFTLDGRELKRLHSLIDGMPGKAFVGPREGSGAYTVWTGAQEQTLEVPRSGRSSLAEFVGLIVGQAIVAHDFREYDDILAVESAVDPRAMAMKVLQPHTFQRPLVEFVRRETERTKVERALNALQFLLSPEQYARIAWEGHFSAEGVLLPTPRYRVPYGNLEPATRAAMMPVYFAVAVRLRGLTARTEQQDDELTGVLGTMADMRYRPALELLLEHTEEYVTTTPTPRMFLIPRFGYPALQQIRTLLQSKNDNIRMNACRLVLVSTRLHPNSGHTQRVSLEEYGRIRRYIGLAIYPVMRRLATTAPTAVRAVIENTLEEMWLEMSQHG